MEGWVEMPRMAPKALHARVDIHISPLTTETKMETRNFFMKKKVFSSRGTRFRILGGRGLW